jgi:hypothetical protein
MNAVTDLNGRITNISGANTSGITVGFGISPRLFFSRK